jgi:hypothetical protein
MSPREPSRRPPTVVPGGRAQDTTGTPAARPGGREATLRAFLRPTIWTLAASIGLVVFTGVVTLRAVRSRQAPPAPESGAFETLRSTPLDARAPVAGGASTNDLARGQPLPFPSAAELPEPARASLAIVDATERGHARGEWSVARKRFEPCPGEDVERLAWIDVWSRILKLTGTRSGSAGATVEQWFDREGRLRAVRVAGGGADGFGAIALLDESGAAVQRSSTGAAPALEALRLTMKDPSSAFFEKPRCEPEKQ